MNRILFILLFFPLSSDAQLLEFSFKAGAAISNIGHQATSLVDVKKPLAYGASLAATAGLPGGIRLGVGISAYRVKFSTVMNFTSGATVSTGYEYGQPLMPIELIAVKRVKLPKISIDLGGTGGICTNNKQKIQLDDVQKPIITKSKNNWYTYGFLVGAQYDLSKHLAVGVEAQPKWVNMQSKMSDFFMMPILLKASFRL